MTILEKAIGGHPYVMRTMSGELMIALYYGLGKCTSSFVAATDMHGPARKF